MTVESVCYSVCLAGYRFDLHFDLRKKRVIVVCLRRFQDKLKLPLKHRQPTRETAERAVSIWLDTLGE